MESLTVTTIPEAKFRRLSRFPQCDATRTDDRYNRVHAQSSNRTDKTALIEHASIVIPKNVRYLKYNAGDGIQQKVSWSTQNIIQEPLKVRKEGLKNGECGGLYHIGARVGVISSKAKGTDEFKTQNTDFIDNILSELNKRDRIGVHRIDILEPDDIDENSRKDRDKNNEGVNAMAISQPERNKVGEGEVKPGLWDAIYLKQPDGPNSQKPSVHQSNRRNKVSEIAGNVKVVHETEFQSQNSEKMVNKARFKNCIALKTSDMEQSGAMIEEGLSNEIRQGVTNLTQNRRFAADLKTTAYRPSTTMDKFRKKYVEVMEENQKGKFDLEEGHRIWEEIDAMITKNDSRRTGMGNNSRITAVGRNQDVNNGNKAKNSPELQPRFHKQLEKSAFRNGGSKYQLFNDKTEHTLFPLYDISYAFNTENITVSENNNSPCGKTAHLKKETALASSPETFKLSNEGQSTTKVCQHPFGEPRKHDNGWQKESVAYTAHRYVSPVWLDRVLCKNVVPGVRRVL